MFNGRTLRTAAQLVMAPGLFIAPIMTDGEKELSITEAVQIIIVIITPQLKMSLSKTAVIFLAEHGLHGIVMAIQEKERELVQGDIARMGAVNQELIQNMTPKTAVLIIGQMNINVQII